MLRSTDERYRQGPDRRQQWANTVPFIFDERGLVEVVSTEARVNHAWERPLVGPAPVRRPRRPDRL